MKKKYSYIDSHKSDNHGKEYDSKIYSGKTFDNKVWIIEKYILNKILRNSKNKKILDFACGTGRISSYLEEIKVKKIIGIDVSESMLKEAKKKLTYTKLLNIDINNRKAHKSLGTFSLIIAFRYFLNADPDLRRETLISLKSVMDSNSVLIFNLHGNKQSAYMVSDFMKNIYKKIALTFNNSEELFRFNNRVGVQEMNMLLNSTGFKVIQIISYSFLPPVIVNLLPEKFLLGLEKKIISTTNLYGTHLLYICVKQNNET